MYLDDARRLGDQHATQWWINESFLSSTLPPRQRNKQPNYMEMEHTKCHVEQLQSNLTFNNQWSDIICSFSTIYENDCMSSATGYALRYIWQLLHEKLLRDITMQSPKLYKKKFFSNWRSNIRSIQQNIWHSYLRLIHIGNMRHSATGPRAVQYCSL